MLESYKRERDDRNGCWKDNPLHNFASHGADAFRMRALSVSQLKTGVTAEDIKELRERALGLRYPLQVTLPALNSYG